MSVRLENPAPRCFDSVGALLDAGVIYFYSPGTTRPKDQLDGPSETLTLSASGLLPDNDLDGGYRVKLLSSSGVVQWDKDFVSMPERAPFAAWRAGRVYGEWGDNLVVADDGLYYGSLVLDNLNNEPSTSPLDWVNITFLDPDSPEYPYYQSLESIAPILPTSCALILGTGSEWEGGCLPDLLPNYFGGLSVAIGTDADHDINIAAGACTDATNTAMMNVGALVKQIDATWAQGTAAGGMASGASLAANAWYHLFVVKTSALTDVMFDSSATCLNGRTNNGVLYYRRIASVLTDSSSNLVPFFQVGDRFFWTGQKGDVYSVTGGSASLTELFPLTVPSGIVTRAMFHASLTTALASVATTKYLLFRKPASSSQSASDSAYHLKVTYPASGSQQFGSYAEVDTDTAQNIEVRWSASALLQRFTIVTEGWIDARGQL